jgi:hypothetical protein
LYSLRVQNRFHVRNKKRGEAEPEAASPRL